MKKPVLSQKKPVATAPKKIAPKRKPAPKKPTEPAEFDPHAIRLTKWLSQLGITSRREAELWITEDRITVNKKPASIGQKIDPDHDLVRIDEVLVQPKAPPRVYWLLNKPDKVLTSRKSIGKQQTLYDLPCLAGIKFLVAPVGRLDYRTEGLLLLSNDGELVHRLSHPKYKLVRRYEVQTKELLPGVHGKKPVQQTLELEDGSCTFEIAHLRSSMGNWYRISVQEGRNRLVRRIVTHMGTEVTRLIRTHFGELELPRDLPPGSYRQLSSNEISYLKKSVGL